MSWREKVEEILGKAKKLEKDYGWIEAAALYEQALPVIGKRDFLRKGEVQERIGYCSYRAAMQAEGQEEFKERMRRAIEAYDRANGLYDKLVDEQKVARIFRCDAFAKYLGYWLTRDPSEKRALLDQCLELEGKALAVFLKTGDMLEYGRTYNELPHVFWLRVYQEWDRQTKKRIVEEGLKWGEKGVATISEHSNPYETARTYFTLSTCLAIFGWNFIAEPEKKDKHRLKVVKYLSKAVDLSEKVGDAFILGMSHLWLGYVVGEDEAVGHFEKALECGKTTRDNYLVSWGLVELAEWIYSKAFATEDPEERRELAEKGIRFYDEAWHHCSIISFVSAEHFGDIEYYWQLATWETDPEKRLEFLKKAEKIGTEALKSAEDSDMPDVILYMFHVLSKIFECRAHIEPDPAEKRDRLEKALKYREKTIEINEQLYPLMFWELGVPHNYLAGIKAQLADIEPNPSRKRKLLEEAVLSKEKCLKLCNKDMSYYQRVGVISYQVALQLYQDSYATLLTHLYDLTNEPEHLRKAIEISQKVVDSSDKLDMVIRRAESYWKIAKAQGILGEHLKAAENFEHASESYRLAAQKIPLLKGFCSEYASYMEAWLNLKSQGMNMKTKTMHGLESIIECVHAY